MEQLFNSHLPSGRHPDIQLCIFPHLPEFLVIDSRGQNPQVTVLATQEVFNEEFYRTVESEFSETIRSSNEFLFSHLINLPIVVEEAVRDIAMTFILDKIGVQVDDDDEIPSVVVYVVSGGALASIFTITQWCQTSQRTGISPPSCSGPTTSCLPPP